MDIEADLRRFISGFFDIPESSITPETNFFDEGIDSLDMIEIIIAMEDRYDVDISDEEAAEMKKFGFMVEWLKARC